MSEVYTETNWQETINAMHSGCVIEIDEGVYDYFLEVLPPVHMGYRATLPDGQVVRASFGFAEGYEPVTAFWSHAGRFFCCRTKEMNPHA